MMKFLPSPSWWSVIWTGLFRPKTDESSLGSVLYGDEAAQACSVDGRDRVRICFRNGLDETILLCWVDRSGKPHHFRALEPCSIENVNDTADITTKDHIENGFTGHVFLLARCDGRDMQQVQKEKSLESAEIIGAYRPDNASPDHPVHLILVIDNQKASKRRNHHFLACCFPSSSQDDDDTRLYKLMVRPGSVDPKPLDTTCICYKDIMIAGWPVKIQESCLKDRELCKCLEQDLEAATRHLPRKACQRLQESTAFWINETFRYGPAACPTKGVGMCFHPDKEWLIKQGCHKEKCECVEMYDTKEYLRDRKHWGTGGMMIHELSHAYHHKCLKGGYDNADIRKCYKAAIKEGLYDCVAVHGTQGPECKAYARTNPMEYFAELSTAFLGGTTGQEEFNKWYPFNRQQLFAHDPRAFELLKRLWEVDC